jgi:hypothetical protein
MGIVFGADTNLCAGGLSSGISNNIVSGNVVLNVCTWPAAPGGNDQDGGDCGGIYIDDRTMASTNIKITNNFVRDVNAVSNGARDWGNCCAFGIYLDDGTSQSTVTGNVVTGLVTSCFMIHGGENNVLSGNLCDIGSAGTQQILFAQQSAPAQHTAMTGNVFQHNLVVGGSSGPGLGYVFGGTPIVPLTIAHNAYYNYVGSSINYSGTAGTDASPIYENPMLTGWTYTLAGNSPVYATPISFPSLPASWGPPGFVVPQNGTPPSSLN